RSRPRSNTTLMSAIGGTFRTSHDVRLEFRNAHQSGHSPAPLILWVHAIVRTLAKSTWDTGSNHRPQQQIALQPENRTSSAWRSGRHVRLIRKAHPLKNASRSALMVAASVVGMPCGKPL